MGISIIGLWGGLLEDTDFILPLFYMAFESSSFNPFLDLVEEGPIMILLLAAEIAVCKYWVLFMFIPLDFLLLLP